MKVKKKKKKANFQIRIVLDISPQAKICPTDLKLVKACLHTYAYVHMPIHICSKQTAQRELLHTYFFSKTAKKGTFCDIVLTTKPKIKSPPFCSFVYPTY